MSMAPHEHVNELYDFYQPLLTPKQATYLDLYYGQDYSLGEIAAEFEVSRQAVYDNIKRTEKILQSYEERLHLMAHFQQQVALVNKLNTVVTQRYQTDAELKSLLKEFEHLIDSQ